MWLYLIWHNFLLLLNQREVRVLIKKYHVIFWEYSNVSEKEETQLVLTVKLFTFYSYKHCYHSLRCWCHGKFMDFGLMQNNIHILLLPSCVSFLNSPNRCVSIWTVVFVMNSVSINHCNIYHTTHERQGLQTSQFTFFPRLPAFSNKSSRTKAKLRDNPGYLGTLLFRSRIRHGSKIAPFLYQIIQSIITEKGVGWYCSAFTQNRSIKTSYKVPKVLKAWDLNLRLLEFKLRLSDLLKNQTYHLCDCGKITQHKHDLEENQYHYRR